jgi:hypothetical protein
MGIAAGDSLTFDLPLKAVMALAADRVFLLAEDAAMDAFAGIGREAFDILWERLDALSKD